MQGNCSIKRLNFPTIKKGRWIPVAYKRYFYNMCDTPQLWRVTFLYASFGWVFKKLKIIMTPPPHFISNKKFEVQPDVTKVVEK